MIHGDRDLDGIFDTDHLKRRCSALFRFFLRLFCGFCQRHCLLEGLPYFIQLLFFKVVHPFGAFGTQVDQLVVLAHSAIRSLSVFESVHRRPQRSQAMGQ